MAFKIERPATAFAMAPSKGAKRPRRFHADHLKFIRSLPCAVCGTLRFIEAAHVRIASAVHGKRETGMSQKPDDCWAVPLCADHHRDGPQAQHKIGEEAFWRFHNIDPCNLALALWCATGDDDRGEAIVNETRARAMKDRT